MFLLIGSMIDEALYFHCGIKYLLISLFNMLMSLFKFLCLIIIALIDNFFNFVSIVCIQMG